MRPKSWLTKVVLNEGYRARGLSVPVSPCDFQRTTSFVPAAGFIRTAFHDVAGHDSATGVGGLDASIAFELTGEHGKDNAGPFANNSLTFLARYYSVQASMADLMALGLYTSVRSCGGPDIATRTGRIDAQEAGPFGVPKPNDTQQGYKDTFSRIGFNPQEMIKLVACGHTLGGVHREQFPQIATKENMSPFDSTESKFDNRVAVEYVSNTTRNPLVTGPNDSFRSDKIIFTIDHDKTIKQLTDAQTFQNECKIIMQKMIDTVPGSVTLSEPIQVYDVKPGSLSLALSGNGTIVFNGEIRVRTTQGQVANVSLVYKNRDGIKGNNTISTAFAGTANGHDDSFVFYSFSASLPAKSSITSFDVIVTGADGSTTTYNNNGKSFPVQDNIFVQLPDCSVSATTPAGKASVNIVAAVRGSAASVTLSATTHTQRDVPMPLLSTNKVTMTKGSSVGEYTYYEGTFEVASQQLATATFDISAEIDGKTVEDKFHHVAGFGGSTGPDGDNNDGGDDGGNGNSGGGSDWINIPDRGNTDAPGSSSGAIPDKPYTPSRPCGELEGCETLPWVHDLPMPGPDTFAPPGSPNAPVHGSSSGSYGGTGGDRWNGGKGGGGNGGSGGGHGADDDGQGGNGGNGGISGGGHVPVAPTSPVGPVETSGSSPPTSPVTPYTGAASKIRGISSFFISITGLAIMTV
ncbi:uncharacterized protein HMPREF1541_03566 [Cyphellophora europaea CBS 101466]|uniref:Peroxidase n=1 Tax=Cyphellophora europaea (strain CBS 101466) TaxID=1220924 RepID=W2RZ73_CYPE1|nr:uncharacterized protein HMPREF1541_03566 [Cyphellophora europaea CBS 101466]ETN41630.1 hypothetical protein HMPREF1541_03566 [Cyphellophora europaea CBS 101466]